MKTANNNGQATAKANERKQGAEVLNIKTDGRVRTEQDRETGAHRYAFAYVLYIGGKFHSVVNLEQWDSWEGMQSMKWGVWNGASMFKKTASVLVYVLCTDGFYRICSSMNHNGETLPAFHQDTARRGAERPRPKTGRKSAADIYAQSGRIIDRLAFASWDGKKYTDTARLYARMDAVKAIQDRYTDNITAYFNDGPQYLSNSHFDEPVSRDIYAA